VAFPVPNGKRGAVFDESLELVRRLLREPQVTFKGEFFQVEDASVGELPPVPLDIWLGGSAPAGLRRIGRYGDGWLASFITPEEAAEGVAAINSAAREAGRQVDQDHFGISIPIAFEEPPAALIAAILARRSDVPIEELIPIGWEAARTLIGRYVEAGLSKFVVRSAGPTPPKNFLGSFVSELAPLQT
jgi:probable F420-dependent oxidoreductase